MFKNLIVKVSSKKAASKITTIVFGALLAAIVFTSYNVVPFFYYYLELENQMQAVIKVASVYTDEEIREKLLYHIKRMEIPADLEELQILRQDGTMTIALPYTEIFYITYQEKDYEIYEFEFYAFAEGKY